MAVSIVQIPERQYVTKLRHIRDASGARWRLVHHVPDG